MAGVESQVPALGGLIIADEKWGKAYYDHVNSTATSASPEPDQPRAISGDTMQLDATGQADGTHGETISIRALRQGLPRPGATAGRFAWSTDDETTERGWLPYNVITGYQIPVFQNVFFPDAILLPGPHAVLAAYGTGSLVKTIKLNRHGASGGNALTWESAVTVTGITYGRPKLVLLPTGRVVLFAACTVTYGATDYTSLQVAISDDNGDSWTVASDVVDGIRINETTYDYEDYDVCYHNGYMTAVFQTKLNADNVRHFHHYLSVDRGASWTLVELYSAVSTYGHKLLACDDGSVLMFYTKVDFKLYSARKRSPAALFSTDPSWDTQTDPRGPVAANTGYSTESFKSYIAPCLDQDGTIQIAGMLNDFNATSNPDGRIRLTRQPQQFTASTDEIVVPALADEFSAEPFNLGDANATIFYPYALAPFKGSLLLFGISFSASGTTDQSLQVIWLGGYSSIDFNGPTFGSYKNAEVYGRTWIGLEVPSTMALWTSAGAGSEVLTQNGVRYNYSGGAAARSYSRSIGTDSATQVHWIRHRQVSGGSLTDDSSFFHCRYADSTDDYALKLRFTATACRVFDVNGAAATATATGLTADVFYDWLVFLDSSGDYSVRYKLAEDDVWIDVISGNVTNDSGSPAAAGIVEWAHADASTQEDYWLIVNSSTDWTTGGALTAQDFGSMNPTFGREMTSRPLYLEDGTRFRASGVAYRDNEWEIPTRYIYGTDNLDVVAVRPYNRTWRAASGAAVQIHRWDLGAADLPLSSSLGIVIVHPNFRTGTFDWSDDASAWTTAADIDTTSTFGPVTFARTGWLLKPGTGTDAGGMVYSRNELAGKDANTPIAYALMTSGLTSYALPIAENTAGAWRETGAQLWLRVAGTTSELAAVPTSGTLRIIHPVVAVTVANLTTPHRYWRLRLPAQETYEGGQGCKFFAGPMVAFNWQPSNGREVSLDPIQEITEYRDGTRTVRTRNRPRRSVEVSWSGGIPSQGIYGPLPNPNPDFVTVSPGYAGLAPKHDHKVAEGIVRAAQGAKRPVAYLPRLVAASSQSLMGDERVMYGAIDGGTSRSGEGDPAWGEVSTPGFRVLEEP